MAGTVRPVTDERDALLTFLQHQRHVLRVSAFGLTDTQARLAPTVSPLTIGGLLKHCALTEAGWIARLPAAGAVTPVDVAPGQDAYVHGFALQERETLAGILETYAEVAAYTAEVVAGVELDAPVPVPRDAPWFPADVEAWSVRWVLQHLVGETARHAGHADLIRESIDGATAFPLLAAVENWNVPWMPAWRPAHTAPAG